MRTRDRLNQQRDAIHAVARDHGASNVRLFGSVARDEDDETSDVDLLVTLEPGRTLLDLARLEIRLESLIGRPVDVMTEASLKEPIRSAALRDSIRV